MGNKIEKDEQKDEDEQKENNRIIIQKTINNLYSSFPKEKVYDSLDSINYLYHYNPIIFFKHKPIIEGFKLFFNGNTNSFELYDFDIIVGIYSNENIKIRANIDDCIIFEQDIIKNKTYFLNSIIPLIGLHLCSVTIDILSDKFPSEIYFICGKLCSEYSKFLSTNLIKFRSLKNKEYEEIEILCYRGKAFFGEDIKKYSEGSQKQFGKKLIILPEIYTLTEIYKKNNCKKLVHKIEQELFEVSMNPNRIKSFLSIDELKKYNIN